MSIVRSIGFDRGIHISSESNRVNRPSWVVAWLLHIRLSPIICYSPLSLSIYSSRIALLSLRQSFIIILKFSLNIPLIHSISLGSFQWNRSLREGMPATHSPHCRTSMHVVKLTDKKRPGRHEQYAPKVQRDEAGLGIFYCLNNGGQENC